MSSYDELDVGRLATAPTVGPFLTLRNFARAATLVGGRAALLMTHAYDGEYVRPKGLLWSHNMLFKWSETLSWLFGQVGSRLIIQDSSYGAIQRFTNVSPK